jgi:hypothetical protein
MRYITVGGAADHLLFFVEFASKRHRITDG